LRGQKTTTSSQTEHKKHMKHIHTLQYIALFLLLSLPSASHAKRKRTAKKRVDPFKKTLKAWASPFVKKLSTHWDVEWKESNLRSIQWNGGWQRGYKLLFVHKHLKVAVPTPFPSLEHARDNTLVLPKRCSLHFYPTRGSYSAYESRFAKMHPAKLVGVTSWSLIFQPDRYMHKEYPCPKILQQLKKTLSPRKQDLKRVRLRYKLKRASRLKHHLLLVGASKRRLPWRRLFRKYRVLTIVRIVEGQGTKEVEIKNRRAL